MTAENLLLNEKKRFLNWLYGYSVWQEAYELYRVTKSGNCIYYGDFETEEELKQAMQSYEAILKGQSEHGEKQKSIAETLITGMNER